MKKLARYLLFASMVTLLWMCGDTDVVSPPSDIDFFPLRVGQYHVYAVEETQYSTAEGQVDRSYQLKLTAIDSFENNSGGITYVIYRSIKEPGQSEFVYLDTWSTRVDQDKVVVNEGNTAFVKLAFPAVIGKEWNGNEFNTLGGEQTCSSVSSFPCDLYKIINQDVPFEFNSVIIGETLEVEQNNNTDPIVKQDVRTEIYARNIGLIYKETTILEYCTIGSCIGQQQIESGIILKQKLIEYGQD